MRSTSFLDACRRLPILFRENSANLGKAGVFMALWVGGSAVIPYNCCLSVTALIILLAYLGPDGSRWRVPFWVPAMVAGAGSIASGILYQSMRASDYSMWQANMRSMAAVMMIGLLTCWIVVVLMDAVDACRHGETN